MNDAFKGSLGVSALVSYRDHLSEAQSCLRIDWDNRPEDFHEIGLVVCLLTVGDNFVELLSFNKTHNYLVG